MLHLVAVLLRRHPRHQPFPGINAQPGALDVLVIDSLLAFLASGPVVRGIIGNLKDFLGEAVSLKI